MRFLDGEGALHRAPGGLASRVLAGVVLLGLAACSETSLNEAPIVDLSAPRGPVPVQPRANLPPVRGGMDAAAVARAQGAALDMYVVQGGDTLYHIANTFHTTVPELARWNGISESAPIFVGQRLRIRAQQVSAGEQPGLPGTGALAGGAAVATAGVIAAQGAEAMPVEASTAPIAGSNAIEVRSLQAVATPLAPLAGEGSGAGATSGSLAGAGGGASVAGAPLAAVGAVAGAGVSAGLSATAAVGAGAAGAGASAPSGSAAAPGGSTTDVAAAAAVPASSAPAPVANAPAPAPVPEAAGAAAAPPRPAQRWVWPLDGRITGKFDAKSKGLEIAGAEDAPVVAVADGEVSYTGKPADYGKLVILRHNDGLLSVYAHAKTIVVTQGQAVKRGQTIATAGKATGSVHFEVRKLGVPVDPREYLPER